MDPSVGTKHEYHNYSKDIMVTMTTVLIEQKEQAK
jgi:hypothetical protein